ncbi:type I-B CRISPR-associated protein Cas7/Csh2 [Larkinella bovis]|uniref:Type I-B CRISPR-associated protein Cas7/Csh2 n=1 Tax=Larkinella bovis TaxID=683041 RepID=A0ABW0I538_9BACT
MATITEKSELLFLYESKYSIPNGDPFTGEQRYDEETKKILVSDVRIKRFIRDYFVQLIESGAKPDWDVYVINSDKITQKADESGSSVRINALASKEKYKDFKDVLTANKNKRQEEKALQLIKQCIDVRLFGGISTKEGAAVNLTGPVQFALLNPSLNSVDLRIHQNTSVFSSSAEKSRGAIGTTTVVPFALCQIHGWINPFSAKLSGLTDDDVLEMLKALWNSVNNANTRSKSNQSSLLLLQIVYANPTDKLYGIDRFVQLSEKNADGSLRKRDEELRDLDDCPFDFSRLVNALESTKVSEIRYYTEVPEIQTQLAAIGGKLRPLALFDMV